MEFIMILTSTQLKQQTYLIENVKKEDIIITKRDRPFAVLVDIERYHHLVEQQNKQNSSKKLEALNALGSYHLGGKNIVDIKEEMYD